MATLYTACKVCRKLLIKKSADIEKDMKNQIDFDIHDECKQLNNNNNEQSN